MVDSKNYLEWIEKARKDLRAAGVLYEAKGY